MDKILVIDKPKGCTSHDVVNVVRKKFDIKKVGHTGTLDPAATGVLVVLVGEATKKSAELSKANKEYEVEITFGLKTSTEDGEGEVIEKREARIKKEELRVVLERFKGEVTQTVPMLAAVKVGGKKLYKLARKGIEIAERDRPKRKVKIYEIKLVGFWAAKNPKAKIFIKCSSGTYIRTLVQDIAKELREIAYMSGLRRVAVGKFEIKDAILLDDLENHFSESDGIR